MVTGLPARFAKLRRRVLSYASHMAALPTPELQALERPDTNYLVGWSCGKERLAASGRPDTLKGSFYVNCAFYVDPALDRSPGAERYPDFAGYTAGNVWPSSSPGRLEGLEPACKELCTLVIDTAALVARACDRFAADTVPDYVPGYLEHVVASSTTTKARLLHYFPPPATDGTAGDRGGSGGDGDGEADTELDSWCGTHVDLGCLTGLTSAMYVDETAHPPGRSGSVELPELEAGPPDKDAGLYIKDRAGRVVKVAIARDALAFQTGEALERITHGRFRAVPHFVRGLRTPRGPGGAQRVARNTLAVFTRPFSPPLPPSLLPARADVGQSRICTRRWMARWTLPRLRAWWCCATPPCSPPRKARLFSGVFFPSRTWFFLWMGARNLWFTD